MTIQAAMALTPLDVRMNPNSDLSGDVPAQIHYLNKKLDGLEIWKYPFGFKEECRVRMSIDSASKYFLLMPVISQDTDDKAIFSKESFLEAFANRSVDGKSIYPYSLTGKSGSIHGGIYEPPIAILLHDLAHTSQQAGAFYNKETASKLRMYASVLSRVLSVIPKAGYNEEEIKRIHTILFYALHEINIPIDERFKNYPEFELHFTHKEYNIRHCIYMLENWFDDCWRDMTDPESIFSLEHIRNRETSNVERYKLLKKFHRDRTFDLIEDGFLSKEQVLRPGAKILGTSYNLEPVHQVLLSMIEWLREELKEGGGLYTAIVESYK